MNFLAHLHLASLANSSLLGNLAADFIRGDPSSYFCAEITQGVMLHRRIDQMVDQLIEVKQARQLFKPAYYRISAVTLDIVWDHFLVKNWNTFMPKLCLPQFLQQVQHQIKPQLAQMPTEFQRINHYLWQERWLEKYEDLSFIADVLIGMQKRRPKLKGLADSFECVANHYSMLNQLFKQFYPNLTQLATLKKL